MALPTPAGQPAAMSLQIILRTTWRRHSFGASARGSRLAPTGVLMILALLTPAPSRADVNVDLLYDVRHTTDPHNNANNFPVVELKLFFPRSFGSFLMKEEIDLDGTHHNVSQTYTELSQSIKLGSATLWGKPVFAHLGYSGGLGLFGNARGGFYIANSYNVGLEYPFQVLNAFCNVSVAARYTSSAKPGYDPMMTLYVGRYFPKQKLLFANSLEAWTTARDQGGAETQHGGKFTSWELESELWYKAGLDFSVGTYVRTTRNVYALTDRWVVYPSVGVRYSF